MLNMQLSIGTITMTNIYYKVREITEFLKKNGKWEAVQTGGNSSCWAHIIESEDRLVVDEARSPRCAQGLEYRW